MSAVDKALRAVDFGGGLFVQPQPDGTVRVMGTNGEEPNERGSNLRFDATVTRERFEQCAAEAFAEAAPAKRKRGN